MHFHNLELERGSPPKNPDFVSFPENLLIMTCFTCVKIKRSVAAKDHMKRCHWETTLPLLVI